MQTRREPPSSVTSGWKLRNTTACAESYSCRPASARVCESWPINARRQTASVSKAGELCRVHVSVLCIAFLPAPDALCILRKVFHGFEWKQVFKVI